GMATVFLARDPRHDRQVAVKVLHPDLAASIGSERFLREVRITARLSHPHILPLLDSGESDGLLYYVMPFMEGETLRARMDRRGALPVADAVVIAREVADALGYAHSRGIVHRDIKPENILLDSGHALVADFGIARAVDEAAPDRITATGFAVGTLQYMSPEQSEGRRDVDARSDLYSLGCVLYEMLAGAPPFSGPTAQAIMARRFTEPAPSVRQARESVSPELDVVVRRALERTPADRYQTSAELAVALASVGTATPPEPASVRSRSGWRLAAISTALVAVLVIAGLAWWGGRGAATPSTDGNAATIAVLPFVNMSVDAEHQYFADGLTDELITSLSRVEGLKVASRTSSFAFKQRDLDVREIGRRLGVHSVLEGSVRRGDGRIRVSVQLVTVTDGYQRWSQAYDRDAQDALVIQEDIAGAIVETLKGRLGSGKRDAVRGGTTDPEAYDLYLRGLFFRYRRTEDGLRRAVSNFREAVQRAPNFARAHMGLAEAYAVLGFYDYEPAREAFPAAAAAATQALRLDPALGAAHATLGYVALYHDWDWPRAEEEFLRAIERDSNYATAHQWYANFLAAMGRFEEAEREMRRAQALDPLLLIASAALGWVFYHQGDYERAAAQYRSTLERDSTFTLAHLWLGQSLEMLGRKDESLVSLQRAATLSGEGAIFVAALARLHAVRGEHAEAERLLSRLESGRNAPAFEIAKVYAALGRRTEAFGWLERAYEQRSHSMVFLRVDPQLATLRKDPAFERIVKRVGL
ncbi:MAG: protein kinase, partial [Gemmatimonadaceae bacterium]|nr:protein kinase [Gemmatimonadaceae bacterium]